MYQVKISVADKYSSWYYAVSDVLNERVKRADALSALCKDDARLYVTFACENKDRARLKGAIKSCLLDMYAVAAKLDYIRTHLNANLKGNDLNVLLHTLVAFDRENERVIIDEAVNIEDGMSIDGIFHFKLKKLRERWDDICKLTNENALYLNDGKTFNELLRFLIGAVNPKLIKLIVAESERGFDIYDEDGFNATAADDLHLMYYLIDLAPLELVIKGGIKDRELLGRLHSMFDAKHNSADGNRQ